MLHYLALDLGSGAGKEANRLFLLLSGAERSKDIHLIPSFPILEGSTQKNAETVIFLPLKKAGTRLVLFIGWRIEKLR